MVTLNGQVGNLAGGLGQKRSNLVRLTANQVAGRLGQKLSNLVRKANQVACDLDPGHMPIEW